MQKLPDELRKNWAQAYQFWFVNPPSAIHLSNIERLQSRAGITDELIVAVMERALSTNRLNIMAWVRTVLEQLVPYGVTTSEEWLIFEAKRLGELQREREERPRPAVREKDKPRHSNVFLQRDGDSPYKPNGS